MQAGEVIRDRFQIEREAGAGGMGTVYRARDLETGSPVALKLMQARGAADAQRFAREAAVLKGLDHPRIVRHVDSGTTEDGTPYLAMEWLEGCDLETRLRHGPLDVTDALNLVRRLAEALGYAHERGVVHRDVKPSNVFLVNADLQDARLLDFGIARQEDAGTTLTTTGAIVGTLQYMAPEQVRAERNVDARADVFALGCVLYECLTGRHAFSAQEGLGVVAQILFEAPPRPGTLRPVGAAVDALVERMLAKRREARPANGAAVALEIATLDAATSSAGRQRQSPRADGPDPAPIGDDEQRVLSVVVASVDAARDATMTPETARSVDDRVRAAADAVEARIAFAANGTLIAGLSPVARGADHVIRAARFALELREILPHARVAVATGLALVDGGRIEGALVRTAIALSAAGADPTTGEPRAGVHVDGRTASELEGRFDLVRDGERTWVVSERARGAAAPRMGAASLPFVGREREMTMMQGAFAECTDEPLARVVVVVGEAGLGKTRLCEELVRRVQAADGRVRVLRGVADRARSGSPLVLLGGALGSAVEADAGNDTDARRSAVRAFAASLVGERAAPRTAAFLGEMIGVPFPADSDEALGAARLDAQLMSDGMLGSWLDVADALTQEGPLLLFLEDIQWGDAATMRFVDAALRHLHDRAFLVLAAARPEYSDAFPDLWQDRDPSTVSLAPLSRRSAERLLQAALGPGTAPELSNRILDAADGHPLVLGQLAEAASAQTLGDIPTSVLGVVQMRLEALTAAQRRTLRAASIYGEAFWPDALACLMEDASSIDIDAELGALEHRAFLSPLELASRRGQRAFRFRHALLREVAYASVPEDKRQIAHAAAAQWLEAAGERDPILLARHYESGGRADQAALHYARAADAALAASDMSGAVRLSARAIELAESSRITSPALRARLERLRAEAFYYLGQLEPSVECAARALQGETPGAEPWLQAAALLVSAAGQRGENDEVERWMERIAGADVEGPSRAAQAIALARACTQLVAAGRPRAVEPHLERLAALTREVERSSPQAAAWFGRVQAIVALRASDFVATLEAQGRTEQAMQRCADERGLCHLRILMGTTHLLLGELEEAERSARHGIAGADRLGIDYLRSWGRFTLGKIFAQRGDQRNAREHLEPALRNAATSPRIAASAAVYLSRAAYLAGDHAAAADAATRALGIGTAKPVRAAALAALARAEIGLGQAAQALEHASAATALLEELGAIEEFETLVRVARAEALCACGSPDASAAASAAKARLGTLAARMDPARRDSFLTRVPENVATMALP